MTLVVFAASPCRYIKGSMELIENLDPEEARTIVDPALKLMIDAVQHYEGYIVQSTGDGILAIFGAPVAREDHPQRPLYAALKVLDLTRARREALQHDAEHFCFAFPSDKTSALSIRGDRPRNRPRRIELCRPTFS